MADPIALRPGKKGTRGGGGQREGFFIRPLGDRVVGVQLSPEEKMTDGGIVLPSTGPQGQSAKLEILAVGSKVESAAVGDVVLMTAFAGTRFEDRGKEYVILDGDDILATLYA